MNTLRVLLVVLTVGVLWAQTTAAQVNPFGDSLDLRDSEVAMLQAAVSALFQDNQARGSNHLSVCTLPCRRLTVEIAFKSETREECGHEKGEQEGREEQVEAAIS